MFDVRVATKLAQIKTKADPNYYRPIWNKFIMYNNQTSTPFLFFCYSIFRQQTTWTTKNAKLSQSLTNPRL